MEIFITALHWRRNRQVAGKHRLAGKNSFPGQILRVTAHLVQSSIPEIEKLSFLLRAVDPKRKRKSIEGQRSRKQLNLVYFQRDVIPFHAFSIRYRGHKSLMCVCTQSCPSLSDSKDCSLPDSSVHGILQARILEWAAIHFSRGSLWSRDWTHVSNVGLSCSGRWVVYYHVTKCL